jgi:hypothetical protein
VHTEAEIRTEGLTKRYGSTLALDRLDLTIAPGDVYGFLGPAFVWDLFGSLLGAPQWLLDATPFQYIGLVPAQALRAAAAGMLAIASATGLAGVYVFGRRDLTGA